MELTLVKNKGDGETTACLMSARALLDGRGLTDDHPSAVIAAFGVTINDNLWWESDEERTRVLMPVARDPRMCGSAVDARHEAERKRAYLCADRAVRVWHPRALDAAGRSEDAARLRALDPIVDEETARAANTTAYDAANTTAAAAAAAWYAARAAADAADAAAYAARCAAYAAYSVDARDEAIALLLELCEVTA